MQASLSHGGGEAAMAGRSWARWHWPPTMAGQTRPLARRRGGPARLLPGKGAARWALGARRLHRRERLLPRRRGARAGWTPTPSRLQRRANLSTPPVSSRSLPVSFAAFLSITSTTTIPAKQIASQACLFWCARGLRRQQLQVVPSLLSSDLRLRPHLLFVAPSIQASGPPSVLCPAPSSCPLHPASSNEGSSK
ncbi:uncharacterized protein [Miscanthus floridulus]|uniref:uncharacterized protein isoform X2 n=1 Tax=Miscanthus floridulus TaxID=154761 RepID=UPI0034597214